MNSMTGFGVARGKIGASLFAVEARSVNHRFCDVNVRLPGEFAVLEPEIMLRVRRRIERGKIDFFVREERGEVVEEEIALARKAHRILTSIQKELGLALPPSLGDILAFRQAIVSGVRGERGEKIGRALLGIVEEALSDLCLARGREGKRLLVWFEGRARRLSRLVESIRKGAIRYGERHRLRLEARLKRLGRLDGERIPQEVAVMLGRAEVTEEIVRLGGHLREMGRLLKGPGAVGRRLDFLAQEMGREINTIGSKVQGARLVRQVIDFKSEMEKVREQIQNIE